MTKDNETPREAAKREAEAAKKDAEEAKKQSEKDIEARETGPTHHVRAKAELYVNDCYHHPGDVLDVSDVDYNEDVMEEVDASIPVTRASAPRPSPSKPIPESGGRELGTETDDLEPTLDPSDDRGGKKRR